MSTAPPKTGAGGKRLCCRRSVTGEQVDVQAALA